MRIVLATALLAVAAFAHAGGAQPYGKPLPAGDTVAVSAAIADFDAHDGEPRRFSGRIVEVCQAEGCWMTIEDDGRSARVMFADHAFMIPGDTTGHAVVHGTLSRKTLTPEQVQHLREDGKGLAVEPVEYRIVADGIEITS